MSNVSNVHDLKPFTAGDKPLTGQRLAKVGYKTTKNNPAKYKSVAASVPHLDPAEIQSNYNALLPFIGDMLETAQDGLIRTLYENANGERKFVTTEEISVSAIIGWLQAEKAGSRLTLEKIGQWFDLVLKDAVFVMLAQKLGYLSNDADADLTAEQVATVEKHVKIYREVMGSLAGGATMLAQKQINGMRAALNLSPDDSDPMVKALVSRLDGMEKKMTEDFI